MLKKLAVLAFATASALAVAGGNVMAEDKVTLRMHSFSGTQAPEYKYFVKPFMERLNKDSDGKLNVEYFPSMQLGGNVSDLSQQLEDGVVDFIVTIPGFTPGRFSGMEGMELPFANAGTSAGQTKAMMTYAKEWLMDRDFKGVKLIHMHATDASIFHTSKKKVDSIEAFDGMKIRAPGRYVGEAIKALGGTPVGLGFSEVYEGMERGQIDGFATNWAIIPPYKLHEVSKFHLDAPVYQGVIMVLMRQESYDALPQSMKDVIDAGISIENSVAIAKNIDALTASAKEEITKAGNTIYALTPEETKRWSEAVKPVYDVWVDEMKGKGFPGHEMFDSLMKITAENGRK